MKVIAAAALTLTLAAQTAWAQTSWNAIGDQNTPQYRRVPKVNKFGNTYTELVPVQRYVPPVYIPPPHYPPHHPPHYAHPLLHSHGVMVQPPVLNLPVHPAAGDLFGVWTVTTSTGRQFPLHLTGNSYRTASEIGQWQLTSQRGAHFRLSFYNNGGRKDYNGRWIAASQQFELVGAGDTMLARR